MITTFFVQYSIKNKIIIKKNVNFNPQTGDLSRLDPTS